MPITRMGVRLISGPVVSRLTASASQPHWNTATVAPRDAPMVSRKPSTPTSGSVAPGAVGTGVAVGGGSARAGKSARHLPSEAPGLGLARPPNGFADGVDGDVPL